MEAIAVPRAVKTKAISTMNISARIIDDNSGLKPINTEMIKTKIPWNEATVAPPKVLPNIMVKRETGATRVSFRKPNCLSQIISIPEKIAVNKMLIAIIPGERNCI